MKNIKKSRLKRIKKKRSLAESAGMRRNNFVKLELEEVFVFNGELRWGFWGLPADFFEAQVWLRELGFENLI